MTKKPKIFSLIINENKNVVPQTFKVKKKKLYKLRLDIDRFDIKVEDDEICILEDDLSFKLLKNEQVKIFFINKQTKDFSYITLKPPVRKIFIPILIPIILFAGANSNDNTIDTTPPPIIEDQTTEDVSDHQDDINNGVIVFPSNITTLGVSKNDPIFTFTNSVNNRVFFHYYIFVPSTGKTIDVGQVAPNKTLEFDLSKYFTNGETSIRIDIKTYKDTSEQIARNSMSFNSTVIIK